MMTRWALIELIFLSLFHGFIQRGFDMSSETLPRPKPGETEEDVLALQEEFLRSGYLPSATLVKTNDENLGYKGIGDIVIFILWVAQKDQGASMLFTTIDSLVVMNQTFFLMFYETIDII